ncbi:bifunctional (p)ppGpp synthetase/guanosine-3',5'-bis(diphosphate) 3'-pyrophosphohydrolase [Prevotella brunnea]|uniref:Bifunctional (P)ppGpp synthetase/guanosine-3',5'-bis(Diphosphate) 3'-pyrophosphohydrolase n=1 Tax=Prevotella brunnea TaxID=2508867 RepID=A0A5C8GAD0_9BACT|nr:RelA/SpoT family protein [Prevotella brunnea]TXJ58923.1 bifunctional (p)ppGpp synthetase/guanosine-3',5'-bis(diphosphate) 3'-pyrophosphohydrolase [Prevotella brunnea]
MYAKNIFTKEEKESFGKLFEELKSALGELLPAEDQRKIAAHIRMTEQQNAVERNVFGLNTLLCSLQTALIAVNDIGLKRDSVLAVLVYNSYVSGIFSLDDIAREFGKGVATIIGGLARVRELYKKNPAIESENFRNLLLSFAEDMRVILIMIADRLNLMRQIRDTPNEDARREVAEEAIYLYAPLAHKLGLYRLKSELEDLSLKYLEHDAYYHIKEKLNQTKAARDAYIREFITPVSRELQNAGLRFHIKGRTKSIHSIWQKMKKQKCAFEGIYDLFAIRIILDAPPEREKMQCWQAYSIVTDMYQPNPKRLRDWLSVPKSNGYECLHITVLGPGKKWVEVQIRSERMDEVAEHGLAAHWRYKGVKAEGGMDDWLASIRSALEAGSNLEVMDQFKLDLYDKEIYVFTPKGDLLKFPTGSTVLDFAYHIHTKVGNGCVGGKVNGKNVAIKSELHSGDTVEITTSANQTPKREWLNVVKSARAKAKIRQALKELQVKQGAFAKEMLERKFKNKKIEIEEHTLSVVIRQLGFKETSDFYRQIAEEKIDLNDVVDEYQKNYNRLHNLEERKEAESAENFELENDTEELIKDNEDVLVIDRNLKGVEFSLAKCCHPIYGDPVFGFVTISGGIKIHRKDCPNAPELIRRFGYRVVKARWSGKGTSNYSITLRVIGNDDIGIVSNITNLLSKEEKVVVRSINIDSHDGLFSGNLVILIEDTSKLKTIIKKLTNIRGVKQVARL